MTKFNELLTANPVQFAALFGAVSADAGPAPIHVRPVAVPRPGSGRADAGARDRSDAKIGGPFGAHGPGVSTPRP
jgi:hypothetical protein